MSWYNSSWQYRIKLTIQSSKVDGDLTDYVGYIDLSQLPADFHSNVKSDGGDIRITKADGATELARELVFYDGVNEEGEVHFKYSGTLSSSSNTDVYIYYGNSGASDYGVTDTYGRNNVWDDYEAVWHMNEDPSGSSPQMVDSTGNGYDLGSIGSMTSGDLVDSNVGKGLDFDGTDDYLETPSSHNTYTATNGLKAWVSVVLNGITGTDNHMFFSLSQYNGMTSYGGGFIYQSSGDNSGLGTTELTATAINDGNAHHIVGYYNQGNEYILYKDGSQAHQKDTTDTEASNDTIRVGNGHGSADNREMIGNLSEVRWAKANLGSDWQGTEHNNLLDVSNFYNIGTQETDSTTFTNGYSYRKKITVDSDYVYGSSDHSSFPLLVRLTDNDLKNVSNSGKVQDGTHLDIRFEDTLGNQLDHEIERYVNSTGELVAWVRIPSLSYNTDTEIYVYFGKSGLSASEEDVDNTWDTPYKVVAHLNGDATDSSGNGNDGTAYGTSDVAGKIAQGKDFDGVNDAISFGDIEIGAEPALTLSMWFKADIIGARQRLLAKDQLGVPGALIIWLDASAQLTFMVRDGGSWVAATDSTFSDTTDWHYLSCVFSDADDEVKLFLDDNTPITAAFSGSAINDSENEEFVLGADSHVGSFEHEYDGKQDEFRIAFTDRSNDWHKTEYANVTQTGFITVGTLEQAPSGTTDISLSESGSGSDITNIINTLTITDTGTITELITSLVSLSISDSSNAITVLNILTDISLLESGSGVSVVDVVSSILTSDSSVANAFISVYTTAMITDSSLGDDQINLITDILLSDSATTTATLLLLADIAINDNANGTDAIEVYKNIVVNISDIGTMNTAISVLNTLALSDAGVSSDAFDILTELIIDDSGYGDDNIDSSARIDVPDSGAEQVSISVTGKANVLDTGNVTETTDVSNALLINDSSIGLTALSVLADIAIQDTSMTTHVITALNAIPIVDEGITNEVISVLSCIALSDSSGSSEALTVLTNVLLADATNADDEILNTAYIPVSDQGTLNEVLQVIARVAISDSFNADEAIDALTHLTVQDAISTTEVIDILADVVIQDSVTVQEAVQRLNNSINLYVLRLQSLLDEPTFKRIQVLIDKRARIALNMISKKTITNDKKTIVVPVNLVTKRRVTVNLTSKTTIS